MNQTDKLRKTGLIRHDSDINSIAISPDQSLVALSGVDSPGISIQEMTSGKQLAHLPFEVTPITYNSVKWSKREHIAAICGVGPRTVRIWDAKKHQILMEVDAAPYRGAVAIKFVAIEFDSSGRYLAIACSGNPRMDPCLIVADMETISLKRYSAPLYPTSLAWCGQTLVIAGELCSAQDGVGIVTVAHDQQNANQVTTTRLSNEDALTIGVSAHEASGQIVVAASYGMMSSDPLHRTQLYEMAIRKSVWAPEYQMSATPTYKIAKACCARGSGSVEFSPRLRGRPHPSQSAAQRPGGAAA